MTNIVQGESERKQIAERVAEFVTESGLTNPFGGDVTKVQRRGRSIYSVLFSRPATLDGVVEIWGKTFIRVVTGGPLEMPASAFESVDDALKFMRLAFVNFDRDAALAVPTKGARND